MIDGDGQKPSPAPPRPVRRQMQQSQGVPAPGQAEDDGMIDMVLKPGVEPGREARRQIRSDRGRGQLQPAWVRSWPAMVFSAADAVAA